MYYVYELVCPESLIPFYVGKGKNRRAYYHTMRNKKGFYTENRYKDNVIRQILNTGLEPIINFKFHSNDEDAAYVFEEHLIKSYGRRLFEPDGILTNLCESSRPPHHNYSEERREKYRNAMMGNKINLGRKQSEQEKQKRSISLKMSYDSGARVVSEHSRRMSSETHRGKIVSDLTRKKMSESAKKRVPRTKESIKKGIETRKERGYLAPNRKPVVIDGVHYQSIREASLALGISEYKVNLLNDIK